MQACKHNKRNKPFPNMQGSPQHMTIAFHFLSSDLQAINNSWETACNGTTCREQRTVHECCYPSWSSSVCRKAGEQTSDGVKSPGASPTRRTSPCRFPAGASGRSRAAETSLRWGFCLCRAWGGGNIIFTVACLKWKSSAGGQFPESPVKLVGRKFVLNCKLLWILFLDGFCLHFWHFVTCEWTWTNTRNLK